MNLGPLEDYLDKRSVAREVNHANRLMEERGWRGIDVSYMAIEEIARALGFSTQESFIRAFTRWSELSPGEFRRQSGS